MLHCSRFLIIVMAFLLNGCPGLPESPSLSSAEPTKEVANTGWRYDPQAPYYDYLPVNVQEAVDAEPTRVAAMVCREMAGELNIIATASERRIREQRIAFTCRIAEPGMQTTLDFGDLVRASSATGM